MLEFLLPLDRRRRLAGDVVDHSTDAFDLVDDAARADIEQLVGQVRPARGHEIHGLDGAQRDHGLVAAAVAGDADGLHRQEHGESL